MNILKNYLHALPHDQRGVFAVRCGTTIGYLKKIFSTKGLLGAEICVSIERESEGQVTRQDLRPDDYWLIWPELKAPRSRGA